MSPGNSHHPPDHTIQSPVLCISGPTACGKTAASLMLAQHFPIEIISMDSALVYRGMDIGTAKPSLVERLQVSHHLIDILDPVEVYSAAAFVNDAQLLLGEIIARGHKPLLVGGTLLYYQALTQGLSSLPQAQPLLRAQLNAEAAVIGWPALHSRLTRYDPITAARLSPNDSQRIGRALEILALSGQPMSYLLQQSAKSPITALQMIALEPENRELLRQRIAQRFDSMLEQGFVDEVAGLRANQALTCHSPSMRCVGYRQVWQYLDGEIDKETLRERGMIATRQLAKRQLTWLRRMPARQIIACDRDDFLSRVLDVVRKHSF